MAFFNWPRSFGSRIVSFVGMFFGALVVGPGPVSAGLMLTPQGVAEGFKLQTFASGFPNFPADNGNGGRFGIAFPSNGTVLVSDLNIGR